jgi:glycosyltransferase involved in cell wall biosynthesis
VPTLGYSGLVSPSLLWAAARRLAHVDVVHVHMSRDLITLPIAWLALRRQVPLVLQTHGMVDPSDRRLARPLDALATRRVLEHSQVLLTLTHLEENRLEAVARRSLPNMTRLNNGVPELALSARGRQENHVLFLGRLHPRKRPDAFVRMAAAMRDGGANVTFELVGPDEGMLAEVLRLIRKNELGSVVTVSGGVGSSQARKLIGRASVLVLPSVDEPYPVTVLEAMAVGTPVIVTPRNGLAAAVSETGCGLVSEPDPLALADAADRVLSDSQLAAQMGVAGRAAAQTKFSIGVVVDQLEGIYQRATKTMGL